MCFKVLTIWHFHNILFGHKQFKVARCLATSVYSCVYLLLFLLLTAQSVSFTAALDTQQQQPNYLLGNERTATSTAAENGE